VKSIRFWPFAEDIFLCSARKKSRWGDESDKVEVKVEGGPPVLVGKKWSQEVVAYAMRVFGSTDLEDHQWKQCDDQLKVCTTKLQTFRNQKSDCPLFLMNCLWITIFSDD
jgi:hypothetical protein